MTSHRKLATTVAVLAAVAALGLHGTAKPEAATRAETAIKRSMPNGKPDVIKVMGNTKWSDIELRR